MVIAQKHPIFPSVDIIFSCGHGTKRKCSSLCTFIHVGSVMISSFVTDKIKLNHLVPQCIAFVVARFVDFSLRRIVDFHLYFLHFDTFFVLEPDEIDESRHITQYHKPLLMFGCVLLLTHPTKAHTSTSRWKSLSFAMYYYC